jgi:excisionase family DNA binding protein
VRTDSWAQLHYLPDREQTEPDPTMKSSESKKPQKPAAYSVDDAAFLLSVSRSTIYALMKSGDVQWVVIGGRRRISAAVIEALVDGDNEAKAS